MHNMNPFSLVITIVFIVIIPYVTLAGFWPFIKAFGLSGLLSFWKEAEQLKRKIKEAIQKLPTANTIEERRNEFVRKYNEINDYFKKDQLFFHPWLEFTEQLLEPSDKETVFQNSIRPEKFFILEYFLKQKKINLKLIESMPGILVGLGVLGTFLGLSISLIPALYKLQGNPSGAIGDLMGGAGVAFFTSVFGLLFSLIFNVVSDKKTSGLQIQLDEFNSVLEKSLKFITEEHLLTMYLEESRQQGKYLSNMDENIALKIGDIIRNSVEQMGGKIQQIISQNNQNISEKFLNDIANQMTKGMGDFSKKQMENMEKTLTSLQDNIPPLISRLEDSQKQSEQTTKTLVKELASSSRDNQNRINESLIHTMQDMKNQFKEITQNLREGMTQTVLDSSKELSNVFEKNTLLLKEAEDSRNSFQKDMNQTADKLHTFTDQLNKIISELNHTTTHNIKLAFERFNEATEQQKQIVEKNKQYSYSLDSLSKELKEVSLSVSNAILELPSFIQNIKKSNESIHEIWNNYEKRFLNVDESAKELFKNISEGLALVSKGSEKYIHNLYQQSSQVSANFTTAVEELQEAISELNEVVNKLINKSKE